MNDDGTSGRFKNFALQMGPMVEVMRSLVPTHIAFNGAYGSLTRDIRPEAEVGETILMLPLGAVPVPGKADGFIRLESVPHARCDVTPA